MPIAPSQALARRGHDVTFALCDQSRGSFDADGLGTLHGVRWLSAGDCPTYAHREDALRELIARPGDLGAMGRMLDGVAQLGLEMCECGERRGESGDPLRTHKSYTPYRYASHTHQIPLTASRPRHCRRRAAAPLPADPRRQRHGDGVGGGPAAPGRGAL